MSRTVQFPDEEARSSETFERNRLLNLNFNDPEDFIPIPTIYASRAVMDVYIERVVEKMKEVREEFSATAAKGLTDSDHVCTVIQAAQVVVDAMVLSVRRHYHQREEGLRTRREREYAAISRAGCFNRIKRTFVTISYSMDIHALIMKMEEEKRTTILRWRQRTSLELESLLRAYFTSNNISRTIYRTSVAFRRGVQRRIWPGIRHGRRHDSFDKEVKVSVNWRLGEGAGLFRSYQGQGVYSCYINCKVSSSKA